MTKQMKTKIGQLAAKLAEQLAPNNWANISQLRESVQAQNLIDHDDVDLRGEIYNWFEGEIIRKAMRTKDEDKYPLFPSISCTLANGKSERRYIRERKMKPIHYGAFYRECDRHGKYWYGLAELTAQRCVSRYGPQGDLFPGWTEKKAKGA